MITETWVLSARALKKWIRNPAAVMPGLVTSLFYIVLFGNSVNPTNLFTSALAGFGSPPRSSRRSRRASSSRPSAEHLPTSRT